MEDFQLLVEQARAEAIDPSFKVSSTIELDCAWVNRGARPESKAYFPL